MAKINFSDIVEAIDQLPLEDQESLIHLLQNRLREQKRSELVRDVHQAQQEFAQGKCKPVTPAQIEDLLRCKVDVAKPQILHETIREKILQECISL